MYPYKKGCFYGVISSEGTIVLEANRFDRVGFFEGESAVYTIYGEVGGGIWRNGLEFQAPNDVCYLFDISDSLCLVKDCDYVCGYLDLNGEWAIDKRFHGAGNFSKGYASVREEKNGGVGLVNKSGQIVVPAEYDYIGAFGSFGATARKGERWYLIRPDLTFVDCGSLKRLYPPSEGAMMRVFEGRSGFEYDFLDLELQPLMGGRRFADARRCGEGKFGVKIKGRGYCYVDLYGDIVVNGFFSDVGVYCKGVAPAKEFGRGGKWGAVNLKGEWVVPPIYGGVDHVVPFSSDNDKVSGDLLMVWNGDFLADDGVFGYYDYDGVLIKDLG